MRGFRAVTRGTSGDLRVSQVSRVSSGTFGYLRVSQVSRVSSGLIRSHGSHGVPSGTFGSQGRESYEQGVNNLLITSIIAQNDQKRASKNRTTTTSAQMRKAVLCRFGTQGSLFSPLNPHFSSLLFCDKYLSYTCEKNNIYKRDRGIESIKGPYKKNL